MRPELTGDGRCPRVLVTGIGGPAAQAFVAAVPSDLVEWFAVDADPLAPGFLQFPQRRRAVIPPGDADAFVPALLALSVANEIDLIVPTVDAELAALAAAHDRFRDVGVRVLTARRRPVHTALDKWRLMSRLAGVVPVPATALVGDAEEEAALEYPVVAKPRHGSGSRGIVMANHPDDLATLPRDGSYVIQQFLPGPEYSLDVLARADGSIAAVVPRERLRTDSGIATVARTVHDPVLMDIGRRAVTAIGLTGIVNVQCRRDGNGVPAVIEINPRVPGTIGLTVASGINMPQLLIEEALQRPIPHRLRFTERMLVRTWQQQILDVDQGMEAATPVMAVVA